MSQNYVHIFTWSREGRIGGIFYFCKNVMAATICRAAVISRFLQNHAVSRWDRNNLCQLTLISAPSADICSTALILWLLMCVHIVPYSSYWLASSDSDCLADLCSPVVVRETPSCLYGPSGCIWCAVIGLAPVVKKLLISGLGLIQPISSRLLSSWGRLNGPGLCPVIYR